MPSNSGPTSNQPGATGMPDLSGYLKGFVPETSKLGAGGLNWNNNPTGAQGLQQQGSGRGVSDYVLILMGFVLIVVGIIISIAQTNVGKQIAGAATLA